MKTVIMLATLALLVGCSNTPSTPISSSGDPPVRYAGKVQVATFDSSPRPPTIKLVVIQETPTQKFHVIAQLTIFGKTQDEGRLANALAWKARQIGADALLMLPRVRQTGAFGIPNDRCVLRANAIVFDLEK